MSKRDLIRQVIKNLDSPPVSFDYGDTWESIKFYGDYEKPSKEAFEAKLQALVDAQPLSKLREERDQRLAKCDYIFVTDYPHASAEVKAAWATYRQALRDLPTTVTPTLNRRGELGGFEWPTQPSP